jgi:murein DD-endopeptidase MepM/ murein hydrolase activator NlpD
MPLLERLVEGPRLVPAGVRRTALDRLPNGRPSFRVTQRFGAYHRAIDFGNYYSGDRALAPFAGRLTNKVDPDGALIAEVRASDGTLYGIGHLARFGAASGTNVARGQLIGYIGDTGVSTSPHGHCSVRLVGGTYVDPWSQLVQNRRARLNGYPINKRNSPYLTGTIYATSQRTGLYTAKGVRLGPWDMSFPSGWDWVKGGPHGLGGAYPNDWRKEWIGGAYRYTARPLVTVI